MHNKNTMVSIALLLLSLSLGACGGSEPPIPTPTAVPTLPSVPTATLVPATATPEPTATTAPTATTEPTATTAPTATTEPTATTAPPATAEPAPEPTLTATVEATGTTTAAVTATTVVTAATVLTSSADFTKTQDITATSATTATPAIKSLRVAINAAFKPFVYTETNGDVAGFDIDLINAIGDAANVEIALANTGFSELLPGVIAGEYDAAISAISITADRSQLVSFTVPYFNTGQAPVSFFNPGQGLTVLAGTHDITGTASLTTTTKIGVKRGTTGAAYVPAETPAQAVEFPEAENAFAALEKGEVDAVIIDIPIIADFIKSNPDSIMLAGGPITEEAYAIAVGKDRPEVLALLDAALVKLRANGTYQTLIQKWFGTP